MGALILLLTSMVACRSPLLTVRNVQSPPELLDAGAVVGEARIGEVGKAGIVGVGCGVSVAATVGGTGVCVGIAA